MITLLLLAFGALALAGVAGTAVVIARDGYRQIPVRRDMLDERAR